METPTIVGSTHTHALYSPMNFGGASEALVPAGLGPAWGDEGMRRRLPGQAVEDYLARSEERRQMARRLVQVFIADPNEDVPLEHSLLYTGEQKLTDLTDQELFFEVDIRSLLEAYNRKRITFHVKSVKERVETLEPARVRDLKMVVVTVAQF